MEDDDWVCLANRNKSVRLTNPDLYLLLPTSGTTGISKLVRLSKQNVASNTESICESLHIRSSDRAITTLPLSYTYGLSVLNTHLYKGATVLLTNKSVLQKEFWDFFERERATSFAGVPFTYELLEKQGFFGQCIPSLTVLTQAGGRLSISMQKKIADYSERHGVDFYIMYGQTEATARMTYLPPERCRDKWGSVGVAVPGGEIHISGGTEGEIVYFGPNVRNCHEINANSFTDSFDLFHDNML